MKIINLSEFGITWNWLRDDLKDQNGGWVNVTTASIKMPRKLPLKDSLVRGATAVRAVAAAGFGKAILVSHGPRLSFYGAAVARAIRPNLPHLSCSFNFTDLPEGRNRKIMSTSYRQVTKFLTYSTVEREVYADYFDIPIEKIDMLHWGVHPPKIDLTRKSVESGPYICALGSQGRDYSTLFSAMRSLPKIKLVVVSDVHSVIGLAIPPNVKIHSNISRYTANNILMHSRFMVLPLRDSQVPCGHVTIVSGMFYNKAIIITNSRGVLDYIQDKKTGLFYEPRDVNALRLKIQFLWETPLEAQTLATAGLAFAEQHCTHHSIVEYFSHFRNNFR